VKKMNLTKEEEERDLYIY